nr:hypothetical protein [uncultured Pseudomonas sp.]
MYYRLLPIILCLAATPVHALDTHDVPTERLHELGRTLSQQAGSSQWQQLWQRVRSAGYLNPDNAALHFQVPSALLPSLVQQTLSEADHVRVLPRTQAIYRRVFDDQRIGSRQGQPLHAVCVQVDWRSVPPGKPDHQAANVRNASLVTAYPCD